MQSTEITISYRLAKGMLFTPPENVRFVMRRVDVRWLGLAGAIVLGAGLIVPARAQDPDDLQRAVGRISLMDGEVSVRRGDSGDWVAGVINAPLMTNDHIATGPNSRTEIQFDASNVL